MAQDELVYTVQVDEVRPGDFVARPLAFPTLLALGDSEAEAVGRASSLLSYLVRDARAQGDPLPPDVTGQHGAAGRHWVAVRIAA
jgi:hypothetical protein